jgi:hypothetical protein
VPVWSRNLDKKALIRVILYIILGNCLGVALAVKKKVYGLTYVSALVFSVAKKPSRVDLV